MTIRKRLARSDLIPVAIAAGLLLLGGGLGLSRAALHELQEADPGHRLVDHAEKIHRDLAANHRAGCDALFLLAGKTAIPAGTAPRRFQPCTATGVRTASACTERTGASMRGMLPPRLHTAPTARRVHSRQNRSPADFKYAAVPCTARPVPENCGAFLRRKNG